MLPNYRRFVKINSATAPGAPIGVRVIDKNIEKALRVFKKKVKESRKIQEVKENKYFIKPSAKKRKLRQLAVRRQKTMSKFQNKSDIIGF